MILRNYNIDNIYENIRSVFRDKGDDYIDLLKMSKIVESMVESGDFCSYPKEFCVEKAKTRILAKNRRT